MFWRVILVLFTLSIFPAFVLASSTYQLKITEFIPNPVGSDSTEEWIEIYNEGDDVDISGLYITDKLGSVKKYIIPTGTIIEKNEYITFYSSNTKISLNNDGDGVALYTSSDVLVDETPESGQSKEGWSFAFSVSTWQWTKTPTPDSENIITIDEPDDEPSNVDSEEDEKSVEPEYTPNAKLYVTEFMPNPEGSDAENEWIEIYNGGSSANIGGYIIADKYGSPKEYKIPKGTTIGSKKYMVFYSSKTPISLNNDGDAIEVKDPNGKVLDSSGGSCGKGKEGFSYAFTGSKWVWTKNPTAGAQNIIAEPTEEELEDDDKENSDKTEVMGDLEEYQFSEEEKEEATKNDQLLGYILIVVAIIGGISYTLYINREWILEKVFKKRRGNNKDWEKLRKKGEGE